MANKQPLWNEATQVYQLDFGGRVTQESAKNFQIELEGRQVRSRVPGCGQNATFWSRQISGLWPSRRIIQKADGNYGKQLMSLRVGHLDLSFSVCPSYLFLTKVTHVLIF